MCTTMRYHVLGPVDGTICTTMCTMCFYIGGDISLIQSSSRTGPPALKALNKINSSILVITGCNAHRCKMRMIETLASSSYRRRSGRAPDALKYGLQSGPRRVLSRHLHKSRRFSILF